MEKYNGLEVIPMRKTLVLSVLSLFIVSIFSSAVFAESILAEARIGAEVEADSSSNTDSDTTDSDTTVSASAETNARAETRKERMEERKTNEEERMETRKGNIIEIRSRQRAHFETARERCAATPDPEKCMANMQKRLALVDKLEEKDLANLERFQEKRAEVAGRLEKLKQEMHFKQFKANTKARIVASKMMGDAEKRFKDSEKESNDAEKSRKDSRKSFDDSRDQWKKECASDTESDACKELNEKLTLDVKAYLTHTLEVIAAHIAKIEARVTASEHLSDEQVAEINEKLTAAKAEVVAVQAKVDALTEASTKDEVKAVTEEVRKLWGSLKHRLVIHAEKVINARMGGIIVQSEQLRVKLAKVLERMAEKGVDTTVTASLVTEFDAKLADAKLSYESAQELLNAASSLSGEERAAKVQEAQNMMKKAKDALKAAHGLVQKIHQELKKQNQLTTLVEVETDVDVEATAEVSTETTTETTASAEATTETEATAATS